MNIDDKQKIFLVKELENLSKKIENSDNFFTANFYFSAVYGAFDKIIGTNYDKMILFAEETLQMAYLRTSSLVQDEGLQKLIGNENISETMKKIGSKTKELATQIHKDSNITNILADILELAYMLTGPGVYLKNMEMIKT